MPEDVALYAKTVADAGYFEAIAITDDDRERTRQYTLNEAREALRAQATDLVAYLDALQMKLIWGRFDPVNLPRIVQLINKTNQFNLMTRRYTQDEVVAVMADPAAFGLHLRLTDRFGDNGIIAIVIGRRAGGGDIVIDTWLMSCRVLGRQVEEATLNLVAAEARRLGGERLIGEYRPTAKNAMVKEHYVKLGFTPLSDGGDGVSRAGLDLTRFEPVPTRIEARFVAAPAA